MEVSLMAMDSNAILSVTAPVEESAQAASQPVQLSRQQIMQATAQCLRDSGYDKTTIRAIAKSLDCAVGSIYRYFKDKRELLFEVAQAAMAPAVHRLDDGGSLVDSAWLYFDSASSDPALYRLMFWLAAMGDGNGPSGEPLRLPPRADLANPGSPLAIDSQPSLGTRMPRVIRDLISHWTRLVGNHDLACQCWFMLHGCITLGLDPAHTIGQIERAFAKANGADVAEENDGNGQDRDDVTLL